METQLGNQPQVVIVEQKAKSNGIGTAGFVLSLVAIVIGWIPVIGQVVGGICWLLGLIFSFIGVFKSPRGLAIAGLVISLFFFLLGLIVGLAAFAL